MTYGWVINAVKSSTRIEDLSFKHHRLIAPYSDSKQRRYLKQAIETHEKKEAKKRQRQSQGRGKKGMENCHTLSGPVRDKVASYLGWSGKKGVQAFKLKTSLLG